MNYQDPRHPWRNPKMSLGLRCVQLARFELKRGVRALAYGQPNTSQDVRRYLLPCVRDVDGDGRQEKLGLAQGNWCAAFASWCADICKMDGEAVPHMYRAGVVELVADAKTRGAYHTRAEVDAGAWTPSAGDLAIWDRSDAKRPETSWWRHVNRIIHYDVREDNFTTIGGNEGREIRETIGAPKSLQHSKLIGFISYYQEAGAREETAEERAADLQLIAAFVEAHRQTL